MDLPSPPRPYVGRLAPSPTGRLHLGHARTFALAAARARAAGGRLLLRIDDLDTARCRPEFTAAALEDLAWLGLRWEEPPVFQSARLDRYRAALVRLHAAGLIFPCHRSRKDLAGALSAPHEESGTGILPVSAPGGTGVPPVGSSSQSLPSVALSLLRPSDLRPLVGTADAQPSQVESPKSESHHRGPPPAPASPGAAPAAPHSTLDLRPSDLRPLLAVPAGHDDEPLYPAAWRPPADAPLPPLDAAGLATNWRFRVPDGRLVAFHDGHYGPQAALAGRDFGDFLVWRKDGFPSYQLACAVDDAELGVTEVVRGADLIRSTFRQLLLLEALGAPPPAYLHAPLLADEHGVRLAKRHDALSLAALRAQGRSPADLLASPGLALG